MKRSTVARIAARSRLYLSAVPTGSTTDGTVNAETHSSLAAAATPIPPDDGLPRPPPPEIDTGPRLVQPPPQGFWNTHLVKLAQQHGFAVLVYYVVLNESMVAALTYALHYNYISFGDITWTIRTLGLDSYMNTDTALRASITLGPIDISGRLAMNFALASSFMSVWTGFQLPFCMATLPFVRRGFAWVTSKVWMPKSLKSPPSPPPDG
jgi:hypothetical protein